jgi:hypothetical protein
MPGWKNFEAGDFFEAADIMDFIMNQQVMIFTAGTAARNTAIGTAVREGMVTYIGNGLFQYYDGTTWKGWPA